VVVQVSNGLVTALDPQGRFLPPAALQDNNIPVPRHILVNREPVAVDEAGDSLTTSSSNSCVDGASPTAAGEVGSQGN